MTDSQNQNPRGRPRRSRAQIENSRQQILDAARALFAAEGYDGVSMRKIATQAGCSPAALYTVFPSKRVMLRVIWEEVFDALGSTLEAIAKRSCADTRLQALCEGVVDFWLGRPDDYRAIFLIEDRLQNVQDRYFVEESPALSRLQVVRAAIVEAQAQGAIKMAPAGDILNVLLCGTQGIAHNLITIPEYPWGDAQALKSATLGALLRGLAA